MADKHHSFRPLTCQGCQVSTIYQTTPRDYVHLTPYSNIMQRTILISFGE